MYFHSFLRNRLSGILRILRWKKKNAWNKSYSLRKKKESVLKRINRYGVNDMKESARKIYETALGAPEGHSIVFLAHNGPTGLGSKVNDICGRDWVVGGGDHGDPVSEMARLCIIIDVRLLRVYFSLAK
eukprot:Gb_33179 [translate_table: standard]